MRTSRPRILAATTAFALVAGLSFSPAGAEPANGKPAAAPREAVYVFLYSAGPNWIAGKPMTEQNLRPHGLYIKDLFEKGVVFAGGAFDPADSGMAIVHAASLEEAQKIFDEDPAITGGVFTGEIRVWRPRFHNDAPLMPAG